MDILKDFKNFFLNGELEKWIYNFRNPPPEVDCFAYSYGIKYVKELDAREYNHYDEEDPNFYKYALSGGTRVSKIDNALSSILNSRDSHFQKEIENLLIIINEDENLFNQIKHNSETDFSHIRQLIKNNTNLITFKNELLLYIGKTQLNYNNFLKKASDLFIDTTQPIKKQVNKAFNYFGYKENKALLKELYNNLEFNRGEFINKEITEEKEFISILTSKNPLQENGVIQFNCETRQAAYIIRKLQSYFDSLTWANIGESTKFKSKKGTLIKANSLSKAESSIQEVKEKKNIDNFFKNLSAKQ